MYLVSLIVRMCQITITMPPLVVPESGYANPVVIIHILPVYGLVEEIFDHDANCAVHHRHFRCVLWKCVFFCTVFSHSLTCW